MSVREKRLRNDFQSLLELVKQSGEKLTIISQQGNPPYQYVIEYRCRGIEKLEGNQPVFRNHHQVEINLGSNYPKEQPSAKFITPIFHPNVYSTRTVCLGGKWTMAETLPELVLRIGKLIQYTNDITNLNSPANPTAKNWALNHKHLFPIDTQTFKSLLAVQISWDDVR